ncbi:MAG TPA: Gfo/Idh/MocA family oxidoreductase [Candidatus Binatia bacterium]|nr:Gfo/Idh/MocA family oxidoreductase [Candidatus Binatia bacterium]
MGDRHLNRRAFIKGAAVLGTGVWLGIGRGFASGKSANDKLNIGIIGVSNRAEANISGVKSQKVVALCDIDEGYLRSAAEDFPKANTYTDFRKLLEQPGIDAVVISTADHTHAVATLMALDAGKHVYCEKPLTHTVHEARAVANAATQKKLATQMGTQIHASSNYRRVVELIQSGAIGTVTEAHAFCNKSWGGGAVATEGQAIPKHLHFDLWLGPAAARPYHSQYLPVNWRKWWDFGGGTLGDMGCHYLDLVHWALGLRRPKTIEAEGPPPNPETTPPWLIVNYQYDGVKVTWSDGGKKPRLITEGTVPSWKAGVLFVGAKGMLLADYTKHRLLPESQFADFKAPARTIPDSIGHYEEWIESCKTGSPTTCNFDYAGALSETVLLGNVAYRAGHKIEWDAANLRVTNDPAAMNFVSREYRKGWTV